MKMLPLDLSPDQQDSQNNDDSNLKGELNDK